MAQPPASNVDPNPPPSLAKPSAPAASNDPPSIANSVMKKDGEAHALTDSAAQARREEELEALDGLPAAAGED